MDRDRRTQDTGRVSTGLACEPNALDYMWATDGGAGGGSHMLLSGVVFKGGGQVRVASVVYHGWYGANALWYHMIDDTTIS